MKQPLEVSAELGRKLLESGVTEENAIKFLHVSRINFRWNQTEKGTLRGLDSQHYFFTELASIRLAQRTSDESQV